MTISKQFKNYRKGNNIKQSDLSFKSEVSRATIWRFENGNDINIASFERLLEAMGAKIIIINKDI